MIQKTPMHAQKKLYEAHCGHTVYFFAKDDGQTEVVNGVGLRRMIINYCWYET